MTFAAVGDRVRGPLLRRAMPLIGVALSDIEVTNTIDFEPVPGLSVVAEPRTRYALDGMIAYTAGTTSNIVWALNAPLTATGAFCLCTLDGNTVNDSVGAASMLRTAEIGDDDFLFSAGSTVDSGQQLALMRGQVRTGLTGGAVQLLFTQAAPSSNLTAVNTGSWLRLTRIGDF